MKVLKRPKDFTNIKKNYPTPTEESSNFIFTVLAVLFLAASCLISFKGFTSSEISPDSGYYLSVATRIAEGWIPFKDLYLEYPPVGLYFYALAASFLPHFNFASFYLINFLFLAGISIVVFFIGLSLMKKKILALLAGTFTLALSLYFQGYMTLLEPFTVFFYCLAILFIIKGVQGNLNLYFFISGVLIFLSFFSKQYGLLILPAIFVLIIKSNLSAFQKLKIHLLIFAGFCSCALLVLLYFSFHGVNIEHIITALSGSGAGDGTYGHRTISAMLIASFSYILRAEPFLLIIPLLFFVDKKLRKDKKFIFLLILNVCGFLPLYFAGYTHYYQLIVPFSVLLGVYLLNGFTETFQRLKNAKLFFGIVTLSFCFSLLIIYKIAFQFDLTNFRYNRKDQLSIASNLIQKVPAKSQVFMIGAEEMYALCNYIPVEPKKYGYMFKGWFTPKKAISILKPGQYIMIPSYNYELYKPYVSKLSLVSIIDKIYIYQKL